MKCFLSLFGLISLGLIIVIYPNYPNFRDQTEALLFVVKIN